MLDLSNLRDEEGIVNQHCTMEAETIQETQGIPKIHKSMGNFRIMHLMEKLKLINSSREELRLRQLTVLQANSCNCHCVRPENEYYFTGNHSRR